MPYAAFPDLHLYYELQGSGPRLLYISGTGGDLRAKPGVFDGPLPAHFETLAYDQRGLGRTMGPENVYTMADYAEDAAALLDHLGWERCAVMGVSFGGMVAQEFAVRHGGRIERLVLACTSPGGAGRSSYPLHQFHGLPPAERARHTLPISDLRAGRVRDEDPERFEEAVQASAALVLPGWDEPARFAGAARQLEARRHHDVYDRLPSLRMPVYVCGGRYDGIAPAANLEEIHRQVRGSRLELFDGGHLFLRQDPAAWPRVIAFLKGESDT